MVGRHCYEIWDNRSEPCEDCPTRLSRETGQPHAIEKRTPDGRFWYIQGSPVFNTDGDIVGMVELTLDITERKLTEEALRKSEDRYRALVETIPHGIQEIDPTGTITFSNSAHNKIYGYSDQELIGKSVLDLQISDCARTESSGYLAMLVKEQPDPIPYIGKNLTKGGRVIDVQVDWNYKRDDQGRVTGFISVVTDITERNQAEGPLQKAHDELEQRVTDRTSELLKTNEQLKREIEKREMIEKDLQESREKYRSVVETANEGIAVAQDGMLKFVNPKMAEITGYSSEELLSRSFIEFIHPDDQRLVMEYHLRRLDGEDTPLYPLRIIHKDGSAKWLENNGILIAWSGRPATLSFLNDITERKRAEEALRESEEKYRELFENESDAVMIFDAETLLFEDANKATFDLYGYSPKEFLKLNVENISTEKEKTRVAVQKVINDEPGSKRVALRYFRKRDGTVFPGEISTGTFIAGGRQKVIGAVRDITERIRAEEALRASEEKYRLVVNNAPIGIVVAQAGCFKFVNTAVMDITGYSEKELTTRMLVDFVHPDDREMVMANYLKRLGGEKIPKPDGLRIVSKEDKIRFVENSGVMILWKGQPATLNFLTDITERKLMEEALRQNEKRFQKTVESAPFGYYRLGKDGRYQYVNPQWESMHGLSGREIIGKSVEVSEADDNKARVLEYFHRALDGQTIKGESKRILENGSYGYHELCIQPVYQNGEVVAIEGFINDLTRK